VIPSGRHHRWRLQQHWTHEVELDTLVIEKLIWD
jgi:hypothetical protein